MRVIYSPWMNEFLEAVSSVHDEILLVSPFIKLSLVRPLLMVLPNSSIKIDVLTRFGPRTFQQLASDLQALELLAKRPGGPPGPTRIYRLNRLHAKVYIFDRERVFLGSSNLSVSGLDRNLEIVASVHDREAADLLYRELGRLQAFVDELGESDFSAMHSRLAETPAPPEFVGDPAATQEDAAIGQEEVVAETGAAPALIATTLETPTAKEREKKIGAFLSEVPRPELNRLRGRFFESTVFQADMADNGQGEELQNMWHKAAERDAERIRRELVPVLGLPSTADPEAAMTPFVHQSWCALFPEILADGLQRQGFQQIGFWLIRLAIAFFFSRQIAFELRGAGAASIALSAGIQDLDFDRFLDSKGLNVLLHVGEIAKYDARSRFETILGLQWYYRGHDAVWPYLLSLCQESLAGQKAVSAQVDFRSRLQEVAQAASQRVVFETQRTGGSEHNPIFQAEARIGMSVVGRGQGSSKRGAELEAARLALEALASHPRYSPFVKAERPGSMDVAVRPYRLATERREACEELRRRLGFPASRQPILLDVALTHAGYAHAHPETRSNRHLAFVGSSLVELIATRDSIDRVGWRYPAASDESTRLRRAASANVLPAAFDAMALTPEFRTMGEPGTAVSDGQKREAVQALLATAFMWGGFEGVDSAWHRWITPLLEQAGSDAGADSTTELQELVQSLAGVAPTYVVEQLPGSPAHAPTFHARVLIRDRVVAAGRGSSKLQARKEAARQALGLAQTLGSAALLDIPPEAPSR